MRKASRLFEIVQILRLARRPVTAAQIAERLGVVPRSIYRDIAALQSVSASIGRRARKLGALDIAMRSIDQQARLLELSARLAGRIDSGGTKIGVALQISEHSRSADMRARLLEKIAVFTSAATPKPPPTIDSTAIDEKGDE